MKKAYFIEDDLDDEEVEMRHSQKLLDGLQAIRQVFQDIKSNQMMKESQDERNRDQRA